MSKRNAYYYFMVEYKDRIKKDSGRDLSMDEVSVAASDSWKVIDWCLIFHRTSKILRNILNIIGDY